MLQGPPRHLRERAGHFHAGGAAADNDEGEQPRPLDRVLHQFRPLEGEQEPPPDLGRIGDLLESGRERRPFVMAEIGVRRSGGEDQIVVGKIDLAGVHAARLHVDPGNPRHDHPDVLLLAQNGADRPSDVGGRQRRGGDLVNSG